MKTVICLTFLFLFVKKRWEQKLERTQIIIKYLHQNESFHNFNRDEYHRTSERLTIGDISCRYNARSPYIRCAVAPFGSCEDCQHYEKMSVKEINQE